MDRTPRSPTGNGRVAVILCVCNLVNVLGFKHGSYFFFSSNNPYLSAHILRCTSSTLSQTLRIVRHGLRHSRFGQCIGIVVG